MKRVHDPSQPYEGRTFYAGAWRTPEQIARRVERKAEVRGGQVQVERRAPRTLEQADPDFVWDDEARRLSARAQINVGQVRLGRITGEEALIFTILPPEDERYTAAVNDLAETMPGGSRASETTADRHEARVRLSEEERRERERDRYHNDDEYHRRRLEQFRARRQTPEVREKERLRARARRAKARAAR